MKIREVIQNFGSKGREKRELLNKMAEQMRLQQLAEDRQKSSNERELDRFMNEEREEQIKEQLEFQRIQRREDINFQHNPINAKNIMKSEWEVLKEKNQFSNKSNMFAKQESVLKSNRNLLKNNKNLMKGGNLFKK